MLQKISTAALSLFFVVYAALQVQAARLPAPAPCNVPRTADGVSYGEAVDGTIRITAALKEMKTRAELPVRFVLTDGAHTYSAQVIVTGESKNEDGLLCASASFEHLLSGAYTVRIESAEGAELSYILAENGSTSKYTMQADSITFYLSEEVNAGSAWLMLEEV